MFVVFFMLLYAMLSFGLGFLVRESMQWAAEDGARAALQFQASREARRTRAREIVHSHLAWLPGQLRADLDRDDNFSLLVCRLNDESSCTASMAPRDLECDIDRDLPCMLQLRLKLPYARHAFTPSLTLGQLELAMPDLQAQAQLLIDQKSF